MRTKLFYSVALTMLILPLLCALPTLAKPYNPCKLPPQISASQLPNVLLVMDFSGSMQTPAYYEIGGCGWGYSRSEVYYTNCAETMDYVNTTTYFGPFKSERYYLYDEVNGYFYDAGDTASDSSDNKMGNFTIGVYGNILNFALTSRMDASMKAMIGGKAYNASGGPCTDADPDCYLRMEGARRNGKLTVPVKVGPTNVTSDSAWFYMRPSTWSNTDVFSDNWQSYASDEQYPYLDLVLTSTGQYVGKFQRGVDLVWSGKNKPYQLWSFKVNRNTQVEFDYQGSWGGKGEFIGLMDNTTPGGFLTSNTRTNTSSAISITKTVGPGTYYVIVTTEDNNTDNYFNCSGTDGNCDYTLNANVVLTPVAPNTGKDHRNTQITTIGGIPNARVRIKINSSERAGAIQNTWNQARWGFMFYKGDTSSNYGRLLVGCGQAANAGEFARNMQGDVAPGREPFPYSGTPTGEAMTEAMNYFKQSGGINSSLFSQKTGSDPYYTSQKVAGSYLPVPCRKSYVLLLSDGIWSSRHGGGYSKDPIGPAYTMHMNDLRTSSDLPGMQNADVFSIFAFNTPGSDDYRWGSNSMKWVAFFGGFTDLPQASCIASWPFPRNSLTGDSTDANFDSAFTSNCQKTTPDACCKEWDSIWDLYTTGDNLGKGIPDNYFDVRYSDELQLAIERIIGRITQQTASSSAVATISQKTGEGDEIIRAMFEANPPDNDLVNKGRLLWWGHLEAFWPNTDGNYSFELYPTEIMCKTTTAAHGAAVANCWDAATKPPWLNPNQRAVFTYLNKIQKTFNTANLTPALMGVSTTGERDKLVNWVLGTDDASLRPRLDPSTKSWILGDIVYSTPVVVGAPPLGAVPVNTKAIITNKELNVVAHNTAADAAGFKRYYLEWRQISGPGNGSSWPRTYPDIKYRDKVAYVGGNDGMVHAFLIAKWDYTAEKYLTTPAESSDIGKEIWAYIPSNLLDQVKTLADASYGTTLSTSCKHRFMVDLAPRSYEVFFDSLAKVDGTTPATENIDTASLKAWPWRTVLIGGERGGGDMYFAIDVTDPYKPVVLWEYSVLRDTVARFNFDDAINTFMDSCYTGAAITPGDSRTCNVPPLPSSWWTSNNHCANCACTDGTCTQKKTDTTACKTKLDSLNLSTAVWKPFDSEIIYSQIKAFPMSWSRPYMGRVGLPPGLSLNACDPGLPTSGSACEPKCTGGAGLTGIRNLFFTGGGMRIFDPDIALLPSATWPQFYNDGFKRALTNPFFLALDVETGQNAFRYVWPDVFSAAQSLFPDKYRDCDSTGKNCGIKIPYSMSDPMVLDIWDRSNNAIGQDGYADYIYVGDMNGIFYGLKMNFNPTGSADGDTGFYIDLWQTKPIPENATTTKDRASNLYRGDRQPLTSQATASLERKTTGSQGLRVIVAAGKHEDVDGDHTDTNEVARMSLYNLRDDIYLPTWTGFVAPSGATMISGTCPNTKDKIHYKVRANCPSNVYRCNGTSADAGCSYNTTLTTGVDTDAKPVTSTNAQSGCRWAVPTSNGVLNADCCETNCAATNPQPCWKCIYDLQETGEKMINKPLLAGGIVFFTSFKPLSAETDVCQAGGSGYLYAFDYMCEAFPAGFNPIVETTVGMVTLPATTGNTENAAIYGVRMDLGLGVPSLPVLDSTGNFIIVQTSTGAIKRIGVKMLRPPTQVRGWRERQG